MEGKASLEHTIHTIAVVGRVKWRPEHTYHIASCALVVDYSIHVWDIRRPYIPFASFNDHTNVTTGIAWKNNSQILLSTSKDSTIFKHGFKDAARPVMDAKEQAAGLGYRGDISYVNKSRLSAPTTAAPAGKSNSSISRQRSITEDEQFHISQSSMCQILLKLAYTGYVEKNTKQLKGYECFIGCAKKLILVGGRLSDICDHNAKVSVNYGKHNATTLWNFIKLLYGSNKQRYEHRNSFSNQKNSQGSRRPTQVVNSLTIDTLGKDQSNGNDSNHESDLESNDADVLNGHGKNNNNPLYGSVIISENKVISEITFENFDLLRNGFIYVGQHTTDFNKTTFPDTALHTDVEAASSKQLDLKTEDREKSPTINVPPVLKVSNIPSVPVWEPHQFIADALILQSDVGDVQTAVSIIIAMGDARKLLPLNDKLIEHWFQSYIDLLHRYQLWNEACSIINLSWSSTPRELNQQSTKLNVNCGDCGRPLGGTVGWFCHKCRSTRSAKCIVCDLPVRGVYAWCQGCSHGGHIEHLRKYFNKRSKCPKCGHLCEYN